MKRARGYERVVTRGLRLALPLSAAVAAMILSACGSREQWGVERGKEVYTENCSACHQPDGRGYDDVYPNLAGNPIVRLEDPGPVIEIVTRGRGSMPSFGEQLPNHKLAAVITYIRAAWGNDEPGVRPAQVK
jgi:mono/diheme cytochrome c family protein